MSERRLGIVVPAFNEEESIEHVLNALYEQSEYSGVGVFLVNNASTDGTRDIVEKFGRYRPDFPLTIVDEHKQGTGSASDAGFLKAISEGYPLVARTDADTHPHVDWAKNMATALESRPDVHLMGGPRLPLKDESYRYYDSVLWPAGMALGDLACRLTAKDRRGSRIVAGANMGTRSETYLRVGGFPHTKIEDADEDGVYVERVVGRYGPDAVAVQRDIKVRTSMRRLRKLGYGGMLGYRFGSLGSVTGGRS
jgi:glycosyltransferase involved in cell wall biosynthesis